LTPVNEVLHRNSAHAQRWAAAARRNRPRHVVATQDPGSRRASFDVGRFGSGGDFAPAAGLQESPQSGVIYITHDLSTVKYFSEHIFVMYAGQVVEMGKVMDMLNNPAHPYTHALLEATSDPDAANADHFKEIPPGEPPSLVKPPSGCRFHPRCPHMMKDLCDVEMPPAFVKEPGHLALCWLHKDEHAVS
jgi:oligopeptide/dipeptide ABC transporter ATP-binding protein